MTYLIAMKGHPATGKSTLAYALARLLTWPLLDKDDIKDHVLGLPNDNDLAYAILWQIVETQLQLGVSLIIDSPFAYPWLYERAQELARCSHAQLLVVETTLDEAVWQRRLEERSSVESTHKIRGWEMMQAHLTKYAGCWQYPIDPEHHLFVNTEEPIKSLLQVIQTRLPSFCGDHPNASSRCILSSIL